jgi:hypothetical protein
MQGGKGGDAIVALGGEEVGSMGAMLVVVTTSVTSIAEIELEENIRRKDLMPYKDQRGHLNRKLRF